MEFIKQIKYYLVILVIVALASCAPRNNYPDKYHLTSSLEKLSPDGNKILVDNDSSFFISGAVLRSTKESRSGKFSVLTGKKSHFALGTAIPDIGPDYFVEVSVWRKSQSNQAKLVVSTSKSKQLYKMTSRTVERDSLGWEKLKLEFFTPANFSRQELKVNIWNNTDEDAYFDDLEIMILKRISYPEYNEEAVHIELDTSDYLKLQKIRRRAFEAGILQSTDDDWVKGFMFAGSGGMKAKLRLKGDWLDHLHGEKWSFRVKLKSGNTWKGMKVFSLQNPMARMGVNEWFLHKVFIEEGVLTTRYGFVPLTFKGRNLGLYAWEEHFVKQLVESQKRREGPILRFLENAMWDTRVFNKEGKRSYLKTPYFAAAAIKPFGFSKIVEDSAKMLQFEIAQNLVLQYKNRMAKTSEIFNVDATAKFFALADVFFARHSLIWHNQRFYYNPVLCKLEPIGFDCFSDIGLGEMDGRKIWGNISANSIGTAGNEFLMLRELFNDTAFVEVYIKYLEKFSSHQYLESWSNSFLDEALYYDSLIKREFPDYKFDTASLFVNAQNVRKELASFKQSFQTRKSDKKACINKSVEKPILDTVLDNSFFPNLVQCYLQEATNDEFTFRVKNFSPDVITILGTGKVPEAITRFLVPGAEVHAYLKENAQVDFTIEKSEANYLFFTRKNGDAIISTEIFHWPEPDGGASPLQELIADYPFDLSSDIYTINNKNIVFNKGSHSLIHPLIIPGGYRVYFKEGTELDITNNALFISYSPVFMEGTKENPVTITSSDFSANGFSILQAEGKSKIENAVFENLNTLNYKGWTLTGAVTFYESDVDISNTTFYRNQCEDALNIVRSDFRLDNSVFDYIFGDAFDSDFSTGVVSKTKFTNIGNDAIDFSGSEIIIENTTIADASDKGISGGEESQLTVRNCLIERANIGIASKDLSTVTVEKSKVDDCNYGIVLLQKKPEYGPAKMILNDVDFVNSKTKFLIEQGSLVIENGKEIKGKKKQVAKLFY